MRTSLARPRPGAPQLPPGLESSVAPRRTRQIQRLVGKDPELSEAIAGVDHLPQLLDTTCTDPREQRLTYLQPVPSGPDAEKEPRVSGLPCSELRIDTDVGGSTR
jgi:hypothetical protein